MEDKQIYDENELGIFRYLQGDMNGDEIIAFENRIQEDSALKEQFLKTQNMWLEMDQVSVPEPSKNMRIGFYQLMEDYKTENPGPNLKEPVFGGLWAYLQALFSQKYAFGVLALFIGAIFGFIINESTNSTSIGSNKVEQLSNEVHQMKETMMLAMLENPAASQRMKAVNYTDELTTVDDKIVNALISTFSYDNNENVRLVALGALVKIADKPKVKEALITALMEEQSPLIQVALADAMLKLQEKSSIEKLKSRLGDSQINQDVKDKFERTIVTLSL